MQTIVLVHPMPHETSTNALAIFDRNNLIWATVFGFAGAALGSGVAVALIFVFVWAIISIAFKRFTPIHTPATWQFALASALYGLTILFFAIAHGVEDWGQLAGLLVFLSPLFLGPRLNLSDPDKLLKNLLFGTAIGAILLVPLTAYEFAVLGRRAVAIAGNPGILAFMSLVFGGLGALNMALNDRRLRILGFLALCAMSFNVFATEMRAAWLAMPLLVVIVFWSAFHSMPKMVFRGAVFALLAGVVVVGSLYGQRAYERVLVFENDWQRMVENSDYTSSLGLRLVMLEAGVEAVRKAPFAGYGLEKRMDAVNENLQVEVGFGEINFSHPHNGFLAALLDAGILGLIALVTMLLTPVWLVWKKDHNEQCWRLRMAGVSILVGAFCITGLTNILFQHDVMDSAFVGTATILLAGMRNRTQV